MAIADIDPQGPISFQEGFQGVFDPPPPTLLSLEGGHGTVVVLTPPWDYDTAAPAFHPVGLFAFDATPRITADIVRLATTLTSRKLPPRVGRGTGHVFAYSATGRDGKTHEGRYHYNLGQAFDDKVALFGEIVEELRPLLRPVVSFTPTIAIAATDAGLKVRINLRNDGTQAVHLSGPARWAPDERPNEVDAFTVAVGTGPNRGAGFYLSGDNFRGARSDTEVIALEPGQSKELVFVVPYDVFDADDPIRRDRAGLSVRYGGRMTFSFVEPSEITGRFHAEFPLATGTLKAE